MARHHPEMASAVIRVGAVACAIAIYVFIRWNLREQHLEPLPLGALAVASLLGVFGAALLLERRFVWPHLRQSRKR